MNTIARFAARASLFSLALASAGAFAQAPALTRAEVVQATLAARANGTLTPAGEGVTPVSNQPTTPSTLTRAAVASELLSARAAGELQPAGEAADYDVPLFTTPSLYSRAQVKASVIDARRAGELIPAGEGPDAREMAVSKQAAAYRSARAQAAADHVAAR